MHAFELKEEISEFTAYSERRLKYLKYMSIQTASVTDESTIFTVYLEGVPSVTIFGTIRFFYIKG